MSRGFIVAAGITLGCLAWSASPQAGGDPQAPASVAPAANSYGDEALWLCRPGRRDACAVDLATTVVAADGGFGAEASA